MIGIHVAAGEDVQEIGQRIIQVSPHDVSFDFKREIDGTGMLHVIPCAVEELPAIMTALERANIGYLF